MLKFSRIIFSLILVFAVATACEGPSGSEGPQGPPGEAGPIGPAGEDGSVMYAGPDAPTADIGNDGDYYLNTNTGEYYGPKDDNGWGNPIIILMGEDGQDGQDGEDGADGEDGSQIYSGTGAPDASLGIVGDYYLDKDSYELYGPKTSNGWGTPLNLKGADGNANVTKYRFPSHNFDTSNEVTLTIDISGSGSYIGESAYLVYLVKPYVQLAPGVYASHRYHIPGEVQTGSTFSVYHAWGGVSGEEEITITRTNGTGYEYYDPIEVIRIIPSDNETIYKQSGDIAIIPGHLDVSDYEAVAEYYGFYK